MTTFTRLISIAVIAMSIALLSCEKTGHDQSGNGPSEKLLVMTTIPPLYSFAANIAGDAARVENLLPSGAGPHDFSLSPLGARKLRDADVLITNGVGLEKWLDKVVESEGGKPVTVDTSRGVEIMHGDPHIWLSPRNAVTQVLNIRDALITADPRNRDTYTVNADDYISRLNDMDRDFSAEIIAWRKKEFVAFHSAFGYFARDYGLWQAAVIQKTPETEPSPKHIASVVKTIKSKRINSIFTETQASHKIIDSLAADLGLKIYSLDTLEKGSPAREWYEEKMRANVAVLREALR